MLKLSTRERERKGGREEGDREIERALTSFQDFCGSQNKLQTPCCNLQLDEDQSKETYKGHSLGALWSKGEAITCVWQAGREKKSSQGEKRKVSGTC